MTYGVGNTILAADLNTFKDSVNSVYSTGATPDDTYGYGQTAVPTVVAGNLIYAADWTSLFAAIHACATHQGTSTGTVPASVAIGDTIVVYADLATVITNIQTNRFNLAVGQSTTTTGGTRLTSTRATSWTNTLEHIFTVDFGSYDAARYFFNTAGQIHVSGDRSGGTANNQNTDWTDLLTNIGIVKFDYTQTTFTGSTGTGSSIGFYDLTASYQTIFNAAGTAPYTGDSYVVDCKVNGTPGASGIIQFRITFTDATDGTVDTAVDGTINSYVDDRRSTGAIIIAAPTYATVTGLAAGS